MAARNRHHWVLVVAAVVILEVALLVLWTVSPEELRGVIVLAGAVFAVAVYLGLYALQRARHW
jgi:NADH:ubiquinone oxidoreductase subunit 3 (subunit A)